MNGHSDAFGSYNLCGTSGKQSAYPSSSACSNGALDLCEMNSFSKMSDCWEGTSEELMMGTVPAPALFLPGPLLPFLLSVSLPLSLPLYGRETVSEVRGQTFIFAMTSGFIHIKLASATD